MLGDVLPGPRQRALQVDEMIGPGRLRREPVVRGNAHPARPGELEHEGQRLVTLLGDGPGAAVDLEEHRRPAGAGLRDVDVELAAGAGGHEELPLERRQQRHKARFVESALANLGVVARVRRIKIKERLARVVLAAHRLVISVDELDAA